MLFIRRLPEVISVFRLGSFGREPVRSASGVLHFHSAELLIGKTNIVNDTRPIFRGLFSFAQYFHRSRMTKSRMTKSHYKRAPLLE